METRKNGNADPDPQANKQQPENDRLNALSGMSEDQSGDSIPEEHREQRHHHQEHGNRKYKMFSNHSAADDQPLTNTDTTP